METCRISQELINKYLMRSYHVHSVMLIKVTLGQQRVKGLKGPKGAFLLRQPGSIAVETFAYGAL